MVHARLEERVRDDRHPALLRPPTWDGADDRQPAWGGVVRLRTLPRPAAVIAVLALAAISVAPVRAQNAQEIYVLFPAGHQPSSPKNEATFSGASSSSTYEVKAGLAGTSDTLPITDLLMDAAFLNGNTKIRITPQLVSPAAFAAVYATGAVGADASVDAGFFEGGVASGLLLLIKVRYDASARFTDAQHIDSQRWGTPRIEIYEGATEDPALAFA